MPIAWTVTTDPFFTVCLTSSPAGSVISYFVWYPATVTEGIWRRRVLYVDPETGRMWVSSKRRANVERGDIFLYGLVRLVGLVMGRHHVGSTLQMVLRTLKILELGKSGCINLLRIIDFKIKPGQSVCDDHDIQAAIGFYLTRDD